MELSERNDLADVLERALLDLARFTHRQPQGARSISQIMWMTVSQAHAQLEHPTLGLGQPRQYPLQRLGQLRDRLIDTVAPGPTLRAVTLSRPATRTTCA